MLTTGLTAAGPSGSVEEAACGGAEAVSPPLTVMVMLAVFPASSVTLTVAVPGAFAAMTV